MGLPVLSPIELEEFLHQELQQDFSDLGIEIEDFLSDLIKTRHEEEMSFEIFNNNIKKYQINNSDGNLSISSNTTQPQTENITQPPLHTPQKENIQQKDSTPVIVPTSLMEKFATDQETHPTPQK
jgi:hypothetical protein